MNWFPTVRRVWISLLAIVVIAHLYCGGKHSVKAIWWYVVRNAGCDSSPERWRKRHLYKPKLIDEINHSVSPHERVGIPAESIRESRQMLFCYELAFYGFPRRVELIHIDDPIRRARPANTPLERVGPDLWYIDDRR